MGKEVGCWQIRHHTFMQSINIYHYLLRYFSKLTSSANKRSYSTWIAHHTRQIFTFGIRWCSCLFPALRYSLGLGLQLLYFFFLSFSRAKYNHLEAHWVSLDALLVGFWSSRWKRPLCFIGTTEYKNPFECSWFSFNLPDLSASDTTDHHPRWQNVRLPY